MRNSPVNATASAYVSSLIPSPYIFYCISVRNSLNFNFTPSNCSIDGILIFIKPISLILILRALLLPYIYSTIPLNWPIMTICESSELSAILVSPPLEVEATVVRALGGIIVSFVVNPLTR